MLQFNDVVPSCPTFVAFQLLQDQGGNIPFNELADDLQPGSTFEHSTRRAWAMSSLGWPGADSGEMNQWILNAYWSQLYTDLMVQ